MKISTFSLVVCPLVGCLVGTFTHAEVTPEISSEIFGNLVNLHNDGALERALFDELREGNIVEARVQDLFYLASLRLGAVNDGPSHGKVFFVLDRENQPRMWFSQTATFQEGSASDVEPQLGPLQVGTIDRFPLDRYGVFYSPNDGSIITTLDTQGELSAKHTSHGELSEVWDLIQEISKEREKPLETHQKTGLLYLYAMGLPRAELESFLLDGEFRKVLVNTSEGSQQSFFETIVLTSDPDYVPQYFVAPGPLFISVHDGPMQLITTVAFTGHILSLTESLNQISLETFQVEDGNSYGTLKNGNRYTEIVPLGPDGTPICETLLTSPL